MIFAIENMSTGQWVSMIPSIESRGIEGSRYDMNGTNAGQVIQNAKEIRDRLASKHKWSIVTIPLTIAAANTIEQLLAPEYFRIRTDYFSNSVEIYEVYSANVTRVYVKEKSTERAKLSFTITER